MKQWIASQTGAIAEQKAKQYLLNKGCHFVAENFRAKTGEIDLIFKDKDQWVFVEVKYRNNDSHGHAAEMFTVSKRQKMARAVSYFLQEQGLNEHHTFMRLDLIAIDGENINWIKNV